VGDDLHVVPVHDSAPHRDSPDCWCGPDLDRGSTVEGGAFLWVHRSADGRELAEPRARIVTPGS
jgi:hypothetical protein